MKTANPTFPRAQLPLLLNALDHYPVVVLMGARQVGKSTLCRQIAEIRGMAQVTLDDRASLDEAKSDPQGLLAQGGSNGIYIDEAQRAPGLFLAIKALVDRENKPGRYLLSGSNQPRIAGAVGDSLQGRALYRTLRPLILSELRLSESHPGWDFLFDLNDENILLELRSRALTSGELDWKDTALVGGFPRAVAAPIDQRLMLLDNYVQTFANRDIREILDIESTDRFESFVRLVATRIGRTVNVAGIANELGIAVNTSRRWLDALSRSYLIEQFPAFHKNPSQRVIKASKLYFVDSALALAAAHESLPTGFHLENLVATDIAVWRELGFGRAAYHWHLASGQEVDFVLELNGSLVAVEIKAGANIARGDSRHLTKFHEMHSSFRRGLLLSSDPQIRVLAPGIISAPWWAVL